METVLDLFEDAVRRYGDRSAMSLRLDDGSTIGWSFRELDRRSRIAAWRLRAAGLEPGERVLTWSPSTPELPAVYFGAMRARLIYVPLDLRMAPDAIERIAHASEAKWLVLGTGRDAPDPREAGLDRFPTMLVDHLTAAPDATFPSDWEAQLESWPRPAGPDVFDLIYTSGTTGTPKGVMLAHENVLASIERRSTGSFRDSSIGWSASCPFRTSWSSPSASSMRCRSAPTSSTSAAAIPAWSLKP